MGDVISSPKFAYGYYEDREAQKPVAVDGKTIRHTVTYFVDEEERVAQSAKSGEILPKEIIEDQGAYDPSRATAKFVVEAANMQGGGSGNGPGDDYPDGWHVRARRLNEDGSYNPKGEAIHFYMSGFFLGMVEPKDVQIVGKMQMRFD